MDSPGWKETARTERTSRNLGDPADQEPASWHQPEPGRNNRSEWAVGESEGLIVVKNSGKAEGAKEPQSMDAESESVGADWEETP